MEVIVAQLPDKAGEIGMIEVLKQDDFCELVNLFNLKGIAFWIPSHNIVYFSIFEDFIQLQ